MQRMGTAMRITVMAITMTTRTEIISMTIHITGTIIRTTVMPITIIMSTITATMRQPGGTRMRRSRRNLLDLVDGSVA